MLPAITASPHLATPSLAYCRAQTSSSPRLSRSLVHACPRRKNSNQNAWACEFNYLIDFWRFGLEGKMGSSGGRRQQGSITKTGNTHARHALVEGAWAYRYPAKVSRHLQLRLAKLPTAIQAISWKAQVRLCKRYRQLC